MRYAIRYGLMLVACGVLLAGVARAAEDDANVSDGPSRGELFEARLRSDLGPNLGSLSATIARPFILPSDVLGDAIYGIDVSHHNDENCVCKAGQNCNQCKIVWSQIPNQKVSFAYIKASQGTKYKDPTFQYHWRTLAQNKIPRGAYHFMSADEDPLDQADHFVDRLEDAGKLTLADLPPCLDLESDLRKDTAKKWIVVSDNGEKLDFWKGQEPDEILGKVLKWLNRVEQRTGRIPIIYTSRGWWNDRIKDEKKFAKLKRYPIWIANYPETGRPANDSPKVPNGQAWALWQFTENGKMKSSDVAPGNLDVNIFRGTLVSFRKTLGVLVTDTTEVARTDDPKDADKPAQPAAGANPNQAVDTNKPSQQVASINPNQASDANNPAQQAAGVNPSQPVDANKPVEQVVVANPSQPTDANKPAQQAASANPSQPVDANKPAEQVVVANPSQPTDANKPAQQAASANPSQPVDANKPAEQVVVANPSQPTDANKPAQQAASANPSQPVDANKPAEPVVVANPSQPTDANKPAEQATSANSSQPADASKPAQQVAAVNPSQPPDASKPSEQTASINPGQQKDSGNPGDQPANVGPNEQTQSPGTNNPRANSPSRTPSSGRAASRAASLKMAQEKAAADKAAADKATVEKANGDKTMVEIVLLNGRVLRVDANIDPGVLSRLIAAIDK